MKQNSQASRPFDPSRVDGLDPRELRYWCKELGCTKAQLDDARSSVGDHVAAIREFLSAGESDARDRPRRSSP